MKLLRLLSWSLYPGITQEIVVLLPEQASGRVYGRINTVHIAPDIQTAGAAKVIKNVQRGLNIVLINQLAIVFGRRGLDSRESPVKEKLLELKEFDVNVYDFDRIIRPEENEHSGVYSTAGPVLLVRSIASGSMRRTRPPLG